jgi:glutaryl-CoA dehydrogenase
MENARQFSQAELWPRVLLDNQNESFDPDLMKKFGQNGFLGCTMKEYDMPGLSYTAYGLINR